MNERRRSERAYLLALVLPATALLIRFNFDVATDHRPGLILFIIPVTLCAYLGGLRPGLLCTLCSALLTAFFLSKLFHSSTTVFSLGLVQWSTFVVAGGMISYFAEKLHQSQERVRLEESRLSGIFNSAIDGIVTVDDKLNVVYINPAAEKMFGYPSATLLGQSGRQLVPPAHGRLCERLIKSLTVSGALNNMVAGPVLGR
ncbi:MAG TPA: DUF4118 domain-containing protein, partial [Burkholderiales bacterium]|nr:DUF4118 domain-containing protein [Burkholderiales bacterium]